MFDKFFDFLEDKNLRNISIPSLNNIKSINTKKHSSEFYLINQLSGYSDTIKYVAVALSNNNYKPTWTREEIVELIKNDGIPSKYKKYIKDDHGKDDVEKKELAREIVKEIIEKEDEEKDELVKKLENNVNKNEMPFVYELTKDGRLKKLEESIINTLKLLIKISEHYDKYKFDISDYLNYEKSGITSTKNFMNSLIRKLSLQLKIINNRFEFDEKIELIIQNVIDDLNSVEGVLWPESNKDILSVESLKKYFSDLNSDSEQGRTKDILKKYKGKKSKKYEDADFKKVLINSYNDLKYELSSIDPERFEKQIKRLSKQLLKENKWLFDYIKKEFLDAEADDDEIREELASQIVFYHKKIEKANKRKKNE